MGELDVATIKSIFEKGAQSEGAAPKGQAQQRRRTIATYGLSPGVHVHKKVIRNKPKQVRISPIHGLKKDGGTKDVEEKSEKTTSKPSAAKTEKIDTSMSRRMTMPISHSFVPAKAAQANKNNQTTNKAETKGPRDIKDRSSESKKEGLSDGAIPTFSGRRSFFDRKSSSASDPKENITKKEGKLKVKTESSKKGQKPQSNKKEPFKSESNVRIDKKVSKFAYASAIKDKRVSAFAKIGHTDRKKSDGDSQSLASEPIPLRRQSLSDLPLPEHESIDIDDFQRSLSHTHTFRLVEGNEGLVSPKKTVNREKDMSFLKDRKRVTSMIQQFSSQPTPIQGNLSNRVKEVKDMPEPPPQPPKQENSFDQGSSDGSEIIEEVTVASEDVPAISRPAESDDEYSYEEVTATEADDFTETDSFMLSSVGMETGSRASYTPSLKSQRRVVVDFQNMELPASKMKEKHMKVVKDLEMLMTKTANQPETKVQRTIKDKMMQDLLHSNKSLVPEGVRQSLLQADLTIHEVSEIVAHMNMCEEAQSPIRWDLIKDIAFPDGINDETDNAFDEAMKQQGGSKSNRPPLSPTRIFPKKGHAATPTGTLGKAAALELFRNQYDLSKDDMADIVAHLTLCEETGTAIRWDLIYQIVYPEDEMSAEDSQTDPGSMMIDAFDDNETVTSWYSIYPEFDECASEITFNVDDEDEVGSLPRAKTPQKEAGANLDGITGQPSPGGLVQRGISTFSNQKDDEQLLRKRIQQLQLASGGKGSFQVHKRKKGA